MEAKGGCCVAKYPSYVTSKVDRIMLRYRPIAPKPASGGSMSGDKQEICIKPSRSKRKSSGDSKRCKRRNVPIKETDPVSVTIQSPPQSPMEIQKKTLPLSPGNSLPGISFRYVPFVYGSENEPKTLVVTPEPLRPVGSLVTVEQVMDQCMDMNMEILGKTDQERKLALDIGTCPAFISDEEDRVIWTNRAYQKLVGRGLDNNRELVVSIVFKSRPPTSVDSFSCRVRVQYFVHGRGRSGLTVPCDVWKMEAGRFAWRLDLDAALSLGR